MFVKYPKTYRILINQIKIKGKHFLSESDTSRLLNGNVVVTEKIDGANTGIIKHKDNFRLQKRGSLVDFGEHFQFNYFKAWSEANREKLLKIPNNMVLYGEWMVCTHTIFYDKLPDYFLAFALYDKAADEYKHRDKMTELCDDIGLFYTPEIARGVFTKDELFKMIPNQSAFGPTKAEGIVVWNYTADLRGKIVREEFVKDMEEDEHWSGKTITKNKLVPK